MPYECSKFTRNPSSMCFASVLCICMRSCLRQLHRFCHIISFTDFSVCVLVLSLFQFYSEILEIYDAADLPLDPPTLVDQKCFRFFLTDRGRAWCLHNLVVGFHIFSIAWVNVKATVYQLVRMEQVPPIAQNL